MSPRIASGLVVLALGVAACGRERPPAADPSARTTTITSATYELKSTPGPMDARPIDETFGGGSNAGIGSAPLNEQAPLLTDPQIVAVTNEAHEGEIAKAEIAKRQARHHDVKNYAVMMLAQRRDAVNRENVVGQKAKITRADSDLSDRIEKEMTNTLATLRSESGKAFDRGYIQAEVKAHERFLETIDTVLLPSVQSSELKTWLSQLRIQVAMHLAKARELEQKLGSR